MNKRIYISGPMAGVKDYNFPLFFSVANRLRELGWDVINPAEQFGGYRDGMWGFYIGVARDSIIECDALTLLEGWEDSDGAVCEKALAQKYGLDIYPIGDLLV